MPEFLEDSMNGLQLQRHTLLGRFLSFTSLPRENEGFADHLQTEAGSPQEIRKLINKKSEQFLRFHSKLADIVHTLRKNKDTKGRVMKWLKMAVDLNYEK